MESSLNDLAVRYLAGKGIAPTHQNVATVAQAIADGTISQTQSRGNEIVGRLGGTLPAGGLPQFDIEALLSQAMGNETGYVDPVAQSQAQATPMPATAPMNPIEQILSDAQLMGDAGSPPGTSTPQVPAPSVASTANQSASPSLQNPVAPVTDNGAQSSNPALAANPSSSGLSDGGWDGTDTMTALGAGAAGAYGASKLMEAIRARNANSVAANSDLVTNNLPITQAIEGELMPRTGGALPSPVQNVPQITNQMPPEISRVPPPVVYGEPPADNIDVQEIQPTRAKLAPAPDQVPPTATKSKPAAKAKAPKAKKAVVPAPTTPAPVDEVIGYDDLMNEPSPDSVVINEADDPTVTNQLGNNGDEATRPIDAAEVMGDSKPKPAPAKMGRGQKAEGFDRRNAKRFMTSVQNTIDGRVGDGKLTGEIRRDGARNYLAIVDSNGNEVRRIDGDTQKQAFEALKQYASSGEMLNDSRGIKPPQQVTSAASDTPQLRGRNAVTRQSTDARTAQIRNAAIRQLNRNNIDPNMLRVEVDESGKPRYFMKFTDRGGAMDETGPFTRIRDIIEFANNSQALAGDALVIDPAQRAQANNDMYNENLPKSEDDIQYEKVMAELQKRKDAAKDARAKARIEEKIKLLQKKFQGGSMKGVAKAIGGVL